jgi:Flp pilus assembly protein TadG
MQNNDRGSELLELAIALPLLLVVIAGIMDFGFLFERYEVITNAAREGARMAVLGSYTCIPLDNTIPMTSDVGKRVQDYLASSGLSDIPTVKCSDSATETLPSGLTVTLATVTVSYPTSFLFLGPIAGLVGGTAPGTINLTAMSTMRVEAGGS